MAEELGERTEEPTPRKIHEARQKGQVSKSQDLAGVLDLIGAVTLLVLLGGWLVGELGATLARALAEAGAAASSRVESIGPLLKVSVGQIVWALTPFMIAMVVVAYAAQVVQFGPLFTLQALSPNLSRLNPVTGLRRLFNAKAAIRTATNLAKLGAVATIGGLYLWANLGRVAGLSGLSVGAALLSMAVMAAELLAWLLAALLFLGVVDYLITRRQYLRDLRMTKQEVQDERRSMEGDPHIKARRMRMARQIALQRVNAAVPTADVVVTNPTHYSVALRYQAESMAAPKVVAKGADWMALRIRQLAVMHGVPMVERAPLARALYWRVEVGREVPPEFYQAVAEVLAYVYRLGERRRDQLAGVQAEPSVSEEAAS